MVWKSKKKIKYSLKREGDSDWFREDTASGNSGDRTLCSNRWAVRDTLLRRILDNWAIFQKPWDRILEWKVDWEIQEF